MSEAKKRSSSQAGLSDEDYEDSDFTVHNDNDSHSDPGSEDQNDEVETRLVTALRVVSGNRQKTASLTPPSEVDDAGITDGRPGREADRDSAGEADDERESSPSSENGDESDDDKESRRPVEPDDEYEEHQDGEDEGEHPMNRNAAYAVEGSGKDYVPKRKIKRRKKYEAEADHSEAIRQKYIEMRKTRTPIACDRCKNLRKECTIDEEGCIQCQTIKMPCMHTDPITLVTERRGASKKKDRTIHDLKAYILKLQRQVAVQLHPYGPPVGQYHFPQHRPNASPNPRSLSPQGNSARWGHASSGSSAEKGLAYANSNGFAPSNNHNNIAPSRKTGKRNGDHPPVTKPRPHGSGSSGSSGGKSGYLAELDKNMGPGGRAKINSNMEKFLERDPDYQKKAYFHSSSPRPRQMSGPGYGSLYQDYHEFTNNAHYPPPPRPMSTSAHRMYDPPYMGDPRYGHPQPGYVNHAPRYPTPPPPHFRPYPERANPEYEHMDPRHHYDGGLRSTPEADKDPYYGLPDAGPSDFGDDELIQAYRTFYPEGESTSAGAAEQARASRTRPKFIPRGMPPGNPPPRPRKK